MVKLSRCLIDYDKLLRNICNDIWNKASNVIEKNLITNPAAMKNFSESNLTVMKLQILTIKK